MIDPTNLRLGPPSPSTLPHLPRTHSPPLPRQRQFLQPGQRQWWGSGLSIRALGMTRTVPRSSSSNNNRSHSAASKKLFRPPLVRPTIAAAAAASQATTVPSAKKTRTFAPPRLLSLLLNLISPRRPEDPLPSLPLFRHNTVHADKLKPMMTMRAWTWQIQQGGSCPFLRPIYPHVPFALSTCRTRMATTTAIGPRPVVPIIRREGQNRQNSAGKLRHPSTPSPFFTLPLLPRHWIDCRYLDTAKVL